MRWRWLWLAVLVVLVQGKGKRSRHHKPGRALLDRLTSTTLSEVSVASEASGSLLPAPLDVAPYSTITANATCGENGAEEYCRETPGKRGVVCDVCEGLDGLSSRRHPASHAVDGDPETWWQSPSLAAGGEFQHVELVAVLPDKMELLHVIVKSGPSPRPLAWSLEVSSSDSGEDWRMIRAFGDRDHCRKLWDLRPERRRRKVRSAKRSNRAEKLTCSTQFASPRPLENGEMHIAIGEGVTARRVRVSFRASHASSPRQQYYSVRALTLAARCLCHGHANSCNVDAEGAKCECQHGTCGARCHRCCSGARWTPHKPCEEERGCGCGERGECAFDHTGAELCVNCTENRAGPLCDRCLFGFFNAVPDGPCLSCDCDPEGSDGSCKWDRKHHRVQCSCFPGIAGHLCDVCEDPSMTFPNCQPPTTPACKCDPRGIVDPTRVCDEQCDCKTNVVGERCDACAPGHYGLSAGLPTGCRPCYCSHVTDSCVLAEEHTSVDIPLPLGEAWLVADSQGNETVEPSVDEEGKPFIISYEVEGWEHFYWLTSSFSGEQFQAYGGELRASLFWGIVRGDTGGNPTQGPDVVLIGADGTKLACANTSHETPGPLNIAVPIIEGSWYTMGEEPELATRIQLMDLLSDVKGIMIRAHYHFDQDEVHLNQVEVVGPSAPVSERCACPRGHGGAQCSRCAWSHVRVTHAPRVECVPCGCNGHAPCHAVNGPCGPCQHNTTGPTCERCLPGHYGNPVQGACKPCACPLFEASNNFSPNCVLASAEGDAYVCTQCPDGYSGDHCENCDFRYWGSPSTAGGSCKPCECGGSPCHPTTGLCLTCPPNAEGARCDLCKEGYWFGPGGWSGAGCVSCACGAGALSAACDARTGQCACRDGWVGRACDSCKQGYGGVAAGCPVCRCGAGSISSICDPVTGECACAAGAVPPSCDNCLEQHYGIDITGCKGCNCSTVGSESNVCDIRTGQCRCRLHVTGRACDTCEEGYWGLERGGCKKCECGAGAAACDPVSGACACAAGVGGAQCDRCLPGYYGFGPAGCLPCPTCSDGKVCSVQSGRCVCPGGSLGAGCRQCGRGFRALGAGCAPCACGGGAVSNVCDAHTGQCKCRSGWAGVRCDACAPGHYGPRCRPCHCEQAGTKDCNSTSCNCDQWGRCPCKENVVGDKCDRCLEGTFGLSSRSGAGCTACFCFGRAARCAQASLARAALHAPAPTHLTLRAPSGTAAPAVTDVDEDSLIAIHTHSSDATITLPWPPVPVYMELDKRFLGDRVTSYGGFLRFRVEEEGGTELSKEVLARFPLVRIYGKNIVLDYYEHVPPANGTHAVRLHESLWKVRGRMSAGASRSALMFALQRVERVLLRATTRAPTRDDHVHALLLNVSLDTAIPGLSRSEPALGVEMCECPRGYAASSCQEPALGFWIPPPKFHMSTVSGTIVIHMEGDAQPCLCNNRATKCDPDTGACLNCSMGTGGPRCAECAPGYHGAPDAPGGCQACPCPSRARNFAAACALSATGRLQCLCKPGYTGLECESCAVGYYRSVTGACVACACDVRGALSARCDVTGRCRCRAHAAGDKCDACVARRTYLDGDGCKPCDNCTITLLDSVEQVTSHLRSRANPAELSRIPKPFPAIREFARNTSTLRTHLHETRNILAHSRDMENSIRNLEAIEHRIFTEANRLKVEAALRDKDAGYLSLESMSALEDILKQKRKLGEQVETLDDFAKGEKHLSAHRALKEARRLLKQIKDLRVDAYITGVHDVFDTANVQSTAVQEYNYRIDDAYRRLRQLVSSLDGWEQKAADLPQLAQSVWNADDAVTGLQGRVKPKLAAVRDVGLRCRLVLEDITSLSSHNLTDDIAASILRAQTLSIRLPTLAAELEVLTLAAEEKEGILYNLTPAYKEKYLEAVEKHVAELAVKAKKYKSLFAGTRAAASLGVTAAQAWANVAAGVREAQALAESAARSAASAAALARGPSPMAGIAAKGMGASEQLRKRGAEVLAKAEELRTQLEHLRRGADLVSVVLRGVGWQEREVAARPRARVAEALGQADDMADRVYATTRALYDEASELRRRVRYNLRRQLAELQRHGDTALGAAQEHVSQIRGNTVRGAETAEALATAAAARARQQQSAASTLSPALQALRDKVQRAKHAANTISVSVTSLPGAASGCSRAYQVSSASGAVSRLALAVSFENAVRDGPLLYLLDDTQEKERYMKLSVESQYLRMSWDLGAGEGIILHPELLLPTHDDADHTSYRIEIERIWNTVHLKVEKSGGSPVTASNSTSSTAVSLLSTQLWLGWPRSSVGLPGCVHALYSDDLTVGLWNFHHQPKEAKCTGCTQRWYGVSGGSGSMAWFSGRGYSALRRSLRPADRRQLSIAFTFRTRDRDAMLFSALDAANNRSVSVVLRKCRVEFVVEYSGSRLRIAAGGEHCDGRAAHVQAIRVFARNNLEKGSLRVNGEETLGSPSPPVQTAAALPDLTGALYSVGGTPPGAVAKAPALLGCLGALTVDREGYDLLDTPTRHGVEPRCGGRTFRSAILEGAGYIELPSPIYRRKAALGLSFRTRTPDGLLLYRAPSTINDNEVDDEDGDDKHYLALVMVAGELELIAAAGKGELRLRTNGTKFNDESLHTVRLIRAHKQLEMWVDEEEVASGTLPGNAYPQRSGGLFLGGVPEEAQAVAKQRSIPVVGFSGTVADLIVDSQLIGVEGALKWAGAQLGRGEVSPPAPPRAEPRALHAHVDNSGCTKTSSYTVEAGAVKFGDTPWSHTTLKTAKRTKDLSVTLQIRTYASEGLLLLVPGSKNKPKHYTALLLREGRLRLVVRGKKRKELALAVNVSDGVWRSVSIRVARNRLVLSSGGSANTTRSPPVARAQRLYVGGIPAPPTLPNIPNSIIRAGGYRGCMRRVWVNGRAEDLVRDARAHHGVGQCFPSVERGAYFGGDAHATWSSSWSASGDGGGGGGGGGGGEAALEVSLQFRSTAAAGVLLAAHGLLLELSDGAVVVSRGPPWGGAARVWSRGAGDVCGGGWHAVRARIPTAAPLSLQLDGGPLLKDLSSSTLLEDGSEAPSPRSPLYIGGVPEGIIDTTEGGKAYFKGCIRDVVIGGQAKDWTQMESLHNVLLDSCPIQ